MRLDELRRCGVSQLIIDYDGGGDEGFTHLCTAQTLDGTKTPEQLVQSLEDGTLGETSIHSRSQPSALQDSSDSDDPGFVSAQPDVSYSSYADYNFSNSPSWSTRSSMEYLLGELACQLLGQGFGVGEGSLEGAFVADLQNNSLTDIAPEEN